MKKMTVLIKSLLLITCLSAITIGTLNGSFFIILFASVAFLATIVFILFGLKNRAEELQTL